jgi:hypothetical protein
MSYYEASSPAESDLWHVQLASGEVCTMTLDLLDDAFQDGIIDERTYVWQEGTPDWTTLGEVAGLDADDSDAAVLMSSTGAGFSDSTWPTTVIAPTYPPTRMDPRVLANQNLLTTRSTAPVAGDIMDIELDDDSMMFVPRKRSKLRWIVAAALTLAIGYSAVKRHELVDRYRVYLPPSVAARIARMPYLSASLRAQLVPPVVQVAPPVQAAAPTPPPAAAPLAPTPVVTAAQPTPTPATTADSRFSDDQKKALSDADKTRAEKQKQKQKSRAAAPSSPSKPRKSENPFHKGGDQFDPLNASL